MDPEFHAVVMDAPRETKPPRMRRLEKFFASRGMDLDIARCCSEGDGVALVNDDIGRQVVEHLPRLRRFAYALTGDRDRGDDLVHDTIVRALSRTEQWQPGTRLDSWMFRIAQNLYLDQARQRRTRGESADVAELEGLQSSDGRDVVESRFNFEAAKRGMASLPEPQRVLVALVCIEGLSYKEAASALGIPVGTVMSRLARARQALFAAIEGSAATKAVAPSGGIK
jgi:RNA polymerase sigma-70 factor (ECF subfamily)